MKKRFSVVFALILCIIMLIPQFCTFAGAAETSSVAFYVSPDGDDNAIGTIEYPLATLQGARDKVRAYRKTNGMPAGGITIYFRGGNYVITEPVEFEEKDSGTAESPIVYRAYGSEKPVFTGGYYVKGSDFKPVTDETILDRFVSEDAKEKVVCYDLKANGITNYGKLPDAMGQSKDAAGSEEWQKHIGPMQVYVDDNAYHIARWPNEEEDTNLGWVKIGDVVQGGGLMEWKTGKTPIFHYTDTHIEKWKSFDNIYVDGWLSNDYFDDNMRITSVDMVNRTLTLVTQTTGTAGVRKGSVYYYYNVLDELDEEGEYYLDSDNGIIYIYPPENMQNATVKLSSYDQYFMFTMKDVSFFSFQNLTFELTRGYVGRVVGGDTVVFSCCTFKNIGLKALLLGKSHAHNEITNGPHGDTTIQKHWATCYDNLANGINHRVTSCEMFNLGYGAVRMWGGNHYTGARANYIIENCRIHDWGQRAKGYHMGINYDGNGFVIRNNEMFNAPNGAIQGYAMDTVIEYNHIYNVVRTASDAGAIYVNYFWPIHDVYIRYNYIHDIPWNDDTWGHHHWDGNVLMRCGIYTDTRMPGANIYGNTLANMPVGYFCSGVWENVENNVFVDCQISSGPWTNISNAEGFTGEDHLRDMGEWGFGYHPYNSDEWRERFPEFYENVFDPMLAMDDSSDFAGSIIRNLIVFNNKPEYYEINLPEHKFRFSESDEYVYEDNVVTTENPGFIDIDNGNYQLSDDAQFYSLLPAFEHLDLSKCGTVTEIVGADLKEEVIESDTERLVVVTEEVCSCPFKR